MPTNTLYYGDNLDILRRYVVTETVDLIYLDPPFNSNATYNVLFSQQDGSRAASQLKAFEDSWTWDEAAVRAFQETVGAGGKVSDALQGFYQLLGTSNLMAYLAMMAPRLVELHRVLKPTGSIYLHCDPTASHYLKVLMDAVFGPQFFQNEVVWQRYHRPKGSQHRPRKYGASTDSILFYSKTDGYKFHPERIAVPLGETELARRNTHVDEKGPYYSGPLLRSPSMGARPNLVYEYKGFTPGPEGWRMTKDKLTKLDAVGDLFWTKSGIPRRKVRPKEHAQTQIRSLWTDIEAIGSQAQERLGYPTQKPEALLERIIHASSNEGDLVLDPFCGCGTTVAVAERLRRRWIGIDIAQPAIVNIKRRFATAYPGGIAYTVVGEPVTVADAQELADSDPYQFQWWLLNKVHANVTERRKGSDRGIDGRLTFQDRDLQRGNKLGHVILSVKAGNTSVAHVRDLRGVVERDKAEIGVLLTMREPTRDMRAEAASAGRYYSFLYDHEYPRLQLLTVAEVMAGKGIDMPPQQSVNLSFKRAPKAKRDEPGTQAQMEL